MRKYEPKTSVLAQAERRAHPRRADLDGQFVEGDAMPARCDDASKHEVRK